MSVEFCWKTTLTGELGIYMESYKEAQLHVSVRTS